MVGLLSVLYIYVFILIQLETFALLAGSLGLFVILAVCDTGNGDVFL